MCSESEKKDAPHVTFIQHTCTCGSTSALDSHCARAHTCTQSEPRSHTYDHARGRTSTTPRAWSPSYVRARGRPWTHAAAVERNSQVYVNNAGTA